MIFFEKLNKNEKLLLKPLEIKVDSPNRLGWRSPVITSGFKDTKCSMKIKIYNNIISFVLILFKCIFVFDLKKRDDTMLANLCLPV